MHESIIRGLFVRRPIPVMTEMTLISLDTDDASLFRNVEENDFTVVDAESVIYKSEYGDPRWIKVLD